MLLGNVVDGKMLVLEDIGSGVLAGIEMPQMPMWFDHFLALVS
jgi:hypothetical protein